MIAPVAPPPGLLVVPGEFYVPAVDLVLGDGYRSHVDVAALDLAILDELAAEVDLFAARVQREIATLRTQIETRQAYLTQPSLFGDAVAA